MLRLVLLSAAIVAIASGLACKQPHDSTCDDSVYGCCDGAFQKFVNISSTCGATMNDPKCVRKALNSIYATQGTAGVLKVCDGYNSFRTCLGRSLVSCTTEDYFLRNGILSVQTAHDLQALYTELDFICGAGMDIFLNNDKCMTSTLKNNHTDIEACREQFNGDIAANPEDACRFETELLSCVQKPFYKNCPNQEAPWWMCELERVILTTWLPGCTSQCSFSAHANVIHNLKKKDQPKKH